MEQGIARAEVTATLEASVTEANNTAGRLTSGWIVSHSQDFTPIRWSKDMSRLQFVGTTIFVAPTPEAANDVARELNKQAAETTYPFTLVVMHVHEWRTARVEVLQDLIVKLAK